MSQAGELAVLENHPEILTEIITDSGTAVPIAHVMEFLGEVVANANIPFRSVGSGNTVTYQIQYASATAATNAAEVGLAAFDSAAFSVDANGFVTLGAGATPTPIGAMQYFATSNNTTYPNPTWLLCDGSVVSQATYTTLYERVGLINEVGTNFNLTSGVFSQTQNEIIYSNGLFVTVGNTGTVYSSTDSVTWTSQTSGTASNLTALTYGNGIYVYGGAGGVLATSTDSVTWTLRTSGTASSIFTLTYGNGLYVYGGVGGVLASSTDAITWTARTSGTTVTIRRSAVLNNTYFYSTSNGAQALATSTDAITWTVRTIAPSNFIGFFYENSTYYVSGAISSGTMITWTSTDSITWTNTRQNNQISIASSSSSATDGNMLKVGNTYLASGNNNNATSTDLFNFRVQNTVINTSLPPIAPAKNAYDGLNTVVQLAGTGIFKTQVYTYNTATSFKLPTQYYYNPNVVDNVFSNLYIKAL